MLTRTPTFSQREEFFRSLRRDWVHLCTYHMSQAKAANGSWGGMNVCGEHQCPLSKLFQLKLL